MKNIVYFQMIFNSNMLISLNPTETATKTCPEIVSSLKMDCPGALPSRVSLPLACNLEVHSTNIPDSKS